MQVLVVRHTRSVAVKSEGARGPEDGRKRNREEEEKRNWRTIKRNYYY